MLCFTVRVGAVTISDVRQQIGCLHDVDVQATNVGKFSAVRHSQRVPLLVSFVQIMGIWCEMLLSITKKIDFNVTGFCSFNSGGNAMLKSEVVGLAGRPLCEPSVASPNTSREKDALIKRALVERCVRHACTNRMKRRGFNGV